jgi:hypothetical protein
LVSAGGLVSGLRTLFEPKATTRRLAIRQNLPFMEGFCTLLACVRVRVSARNMWRRSRPAAVPENDAFSLRPRSAVHHPATHSTAFNYCLRLLATASAPQPLELETAKARCEFVVV